MNPENNSYQDEEIDLYALWLTLKKRWSVILIITLVAIGLALLYASLAPKVYRVHNVLLSNQNQDCDLFNQTEMIAVVSLLDKLNKLTDLEKNKVFTMLGMREEDLENMKNIKTSEIKGSSALWVDIDTYDRKTGVALMDALPAFILSNPNIANKLKMQKTLMLKNREDLKTIIDNPTRNLKLSRNAVVYLPSIDLYALREKYNRINLILEKIDNGQLVSLAWKTEMPMKIIWPKKILCLLIGVVTGGLLGVLLAFFMEWAENAPNRDIKNFE